MTPDKVEAATMPANKMPEMPEAVAWRFQDGDEGDWGYEDNPAWAEKYPKLYGPLYTADQMRAMYLAGIEAARSAVAADTIPPMKCWSVGYMAGRIDARAETLTNLTALEQEAGSADKADGRYTPEIRAAINKLSPKG